MTGIKRLLRDDRVLFLLSLFCAIIAWFAVTDAVDPDTVREIYDIPVTIDIASAGSIRKELDAVYDSPPVVDVTVAGERYIVHNLTAEDIKVEAKLGDVVGPGTWELRLEARPAAGGRFTVEEITPSTVWVRFDNIITKRIKLDTDIKGVTFPFGYKLMEEVVEPAEILLTGPEADISRVHRAVAHYEFNRSITFTEKVTAQILFYDAADEIVVSQFIKPDYSEAEVTLPVFKEKILPLHVDFVGVPEGFDVSRFEYSISPAVVEAAGPEKLMDDTESIGAGYIDLSDFDIFRTYSFRYSLPTGMVLSDPELEPQAEISFDSSGFASAVFAVSDIRIIGKPTDMRVNVITKSLSSVRIIGPKAQIAALKANEIVAVADLASREITLEGQIRVPVSIVIPSGDLMWAVGDYQVQLSVER